MSGASMFETAKERVRDQVMCLPETRTAEKEDVEVWGRKFVTLMVRPFLVVNEFC